MWFPWSSQWSNLPWCGSFHGFTWHLWDISGHKASWVILCLFVFSSKWRLCLNEKLCSRNKLFPFEALSPNMTFEGFVERNNLCSYTVLHVNCALPFTLQEKFRPILRSSILRQDLHRKAGSFKKSFPDYMHSTQVYIYIYTHTHTYMYMCVYICTTEVRKNIFSLFPTSILFLLLGVYSSQVFWYICL